MSTLRIDVGARWFAGKSRQVTDVTRVGGAGGLSLLDVAYADGGSERYLDVPDGFAWAPLVEALRADGSVAGDGGRLELRPGPALDRLIAAALSPQLIPATDQSNTLVALGPGLLVKAYRRLEAGPHPEVELLTALAGSPAPVPAFAGSVAWVPAGGPEIAVAILQERFADAEDGWEAPIERVAAALREGPPYPVGEWAGAGRVAGELHSALADAFGLSPGDGNDLARWRADAGAALAEAAARDAELAGWADAIADRLSALERASPPPLTRIHGDLHLGQFLRKPGSPARPLVIDFEGDPTRPLAERLRPDTPLRDLASLLRCIDHIGSAASRRAADVDPVAWIAAASRAVLDAYEPIAPVPVDRPLLAALELAKECGEYVYAQRVAPEWLYAPRRGMRRLMRTTP